MATIKKNSNCLNYGDFSTVVLTNKQCVIRRCFEGKNIFIAINADENDYVAYADYGKNQVTDLISSDIIEVSSGLRMPSYSAFIFE